ncbi:MAG: hypothetical protein WAQ98_14710 [Blastocatellia bacterium]
MTSRESDLYMSAASAALKDLTKACNLMASDDERTFKKYTSITDKSKSAANIPMNTQEGIKKAEKSLFEIKAEFAHVYSDYRNSVDRYALTVNNTTQLFEENYKEFIKATLLPVVRDRNIAAEKLQSLFNQVRETVAQSQTVLEKFVVFTDNIIRNGIGTDSALESSQKLLIKAKQQLADTSLNISKFSEETIARLRRDLGQQ